MSVTATCFPACIHNGTCVRPNKCECPKGYKGDHCQKGVESVLNGSVFSWFICIQLVYMYFVSEQCVASPTAAATASVSNRTSARATRASTVVTATCARAPVAMTPIRRARMAARVCATTGACVAMVTRESSASSVSSVPLFYVTHNYSRAAQHLSKCLLVCLFTAICKRSCGEHGACAAPNLCECEWGFRGRWCDKSKC